MLVKMNIRGRLVPLSALVVLLAIAWLFFLKKKPPSFVGKSEGTLQPLSGQTWKRIDNPVEDGWETEVLATEVSGQLDKLSALITADTEPGPGVLAAIAAGSFTCRDLRPGNLEVVFEGPALEVKREKSGTEETRALDQWWAG